MSTVNMLDVYVKSAPSNQNVLDLFANEWVSILPTDCGLTAAPAQVPLFADQRMEWAIAQMGGLEGKTCLELGPLDGGHSYMIHQAGARHLTAIEANSRAFLRCLCIKEIFGLDRVSFKLGDFTKYLEEKRIEKAHFDASFANGVLYHLRNPAEVIRDLCSTTDSLCVWTHYYDKNIIDAQPNIARCHEPVVTEAFDGIEIQYSKRYYLEALNNKIYCGGTAEYANWLTRPTIVALLHRYGFTSVEIAFDVPHHPKGPAFAFVAKK